MPRITKEPEVRKQEILETAMRLFYEKGYEKTSIADIANAMNVAQGLCYRYYPSKEALFDAAISAYAGSIVDKLRESWSDKDITLKELILTSPSSIDIERDDSYAYKVCHGPQGEKIHRQLSLEVCERLVPIVADRLKASISHGEVYIDDVETSASFIVYGQIGVLNRHDLSQDEKEQRIRKFMYDLVLKLKP